MRLHSLRIKGYKSFKNEAFFLFENRKINTLIGKNNVGKTAVLEAIELLKKSASLIGNDINPINTSLINGEKLDIEVSFLIDSRFTQFPAFNDFVEDLKTRLGVIEIRQLVAIKEQAIFRQEARLSYCFEASRSDRNNCFLSWSKVLINDIVVFDLKKIIDIDQTRTPVPWTRYQAYIDYQLAQVNGYTRILTASPFLMEFSEAFVSFTKGIFKVSHLRSGPVDYFSLAHNDARNILNEQLSHSAFSLHQWSQSNKKKFNKVLQFIHEVDGDVGDLRFLTDTNGRMSVSLASSPDSDAPFASLAESGAGLAQLLALAVVILDDANNISTILIDEPDTFLHPTAVELLAQLLLDSKKTSIITSHSTHILNKSSSIILISKRELTSYSVQSSDFKTLKTLISEEIGIPYFQLLGRDKILWVEGVTEYEVLNEYGKNHAEGMIAKVAIFSLPNTGMIENSKVRGHILKVLSKINTDMKIKSSFLIDRELRRDEECIKIQESLGEIKVQFTNKKQFEDYLLDKDSIFLLLSQLAEDFSIEFNKDIDVNTYIDEIISSNGEKAHKKLDQITQKILNIEYDKVKHGKMLFNIMIEDSNPLVLEFIKEVEEVIQQM